MATDYSKAPYWAISGIGYGKGFTLEEAVANHDQTQRRNYRDQLAVPVEEVPLLVWQAPEDVDGFLLDGRVRWTLDGKVVKDAEVDQIVGARRQDAWWYDQMAEAGHDYVRL